MIRNSWKASFVVLVVFSLTATFSWAKAESNPADEAAIKKLVASFTNCFNNKDARACALLYTEDGDFTNVRGENDHGRPAVEKHYQMVFSTFLKNAHRTDTVRGVQFLSRRIACVDSDFEMTGATAPNATEAARPVRKGLLTWIVTKDKSGEWHIAIFHELDYPGK
jgi:uncharacterized protein (TIGR02246 family)